MRLDIVQIPQRRRTDVQRMYASDIVRITCRYGDIVRISYGYSTDMVRISFERSRSVDIVRISYGYSTDIVPISYGRTGDVRGMYGGCTGDVRLDIVQIPYGYRTDITEPLEPSAPRDLAI